MQPIDQFTNIAAFVPMLGSGSSAQPFKTVEDYDNWLKRADAVPAIFDQAIANMREGIKAGVVQPKALMTKVLPQMDGIINDDPTKTTFWGPIANMPKEFSEADRKRLTDAYRAMIADSMMPAYKRLRTFIADEYLPACRDTVSLTALPDGEAWYAFNAKTQTTTELTPAQIHDIGLTEVARIHGEMREVMQQVGFKGDLQAFFKFMTTDKQFEFKSEKELLEAYNALRAKSRRPDSGAVLAVAEGRFRNPSGRTVPRRIDGRWPVLPAQRRRHPSGHFLREHLRPAQPQEMGRRRPVPA